MANNSVFIKVLHITLILFIIVLNVNYAYDSSAFGCNIVQNSDDLTNSLTELKCNVRTLHDQVSPSIFSVNKIDRVNSVRIICSDIVLFESSLNTGLLPILLRSLLRKNSTPLRITLEQCQLRKIGTGLLSALPGSPRFQSIAIKSSDAPAGWSLSIDRGAFSGLPALTDLDLSATNIWSIPRDTFCSLSGLKSLNLTHNKLQEVNHIAKGPELVPCINCKENERFQEELLSSPRCLRSLELLDLSYNDITILPDYFLSSLRSLTELKITYNQISTVEERSLSGLGQLQKLDLTGNKLSFLPPDWLNDCKSLTEVRLADNTISVLGPGLFTELSHLLLLDLSRNQLSPGTVGLNKDTFKGLIRLIVLDLTGNKLTRLDTTVFKDLYALQVLRLAGNQLISISDGTFSSLGNLHALELAENQLSELPSKILSPLRALRRLGVSQNQLEILDKNSLVNCSDLRELELAENKFDTIETELLKSLPRLETLDLSKNKLSILPDFPSLLTLQVLRVSNNNIKTVSRDNLIKLSALRMLDLSGNSLSSFEPGALSKNIKLEALRLDNNHLIDLNDALTNAPDNLLFLNASDNHLQHFDFALLPGRVEWLDLHHNKLTRLSNFGGQGGRALRTLDLSENYLERLEASDVPDHLHRLYASDNRILHLATGTFLSKKNLTVIDLAGNQIAGLELAALQLGTTIAANEPLPEILLARNPLICDCELEWLQTVNSLAERVRRYPKISDIAAVTCFSPHSRSNTSPVPIINLSPSQFLCRYETHCFALCHCCDFDACDCEMQCPDNCTCYHDQSWSANVVDCSANSHSHLPDRLPMDATQLFLDGNNLGELTSHSFIGKRKLQNLFLNASRITTVHNRTFNGLVSLKTLHLQDNLLTEIQGHEFYGLDTLKELYLENNAIITIHKDAFVDLLNLRKLRLDGNRLVDFVPWNILPNHEGKLQISLSGNWWSCRNCELIERLSTWTDSTTQMLCIDTQHRPNSRLNLSVSTAIQRCTLHKNGASSASIQHDDYSDTLSTSFFTLIALSLVVILVFAILAFAFRKRISIWIKNIRLNHHNNIDDNEETGKLYDAYIVYDNRDELVITKEISSKLETAGASLCMHHRDLPACHLSASVVSAIDASKRTIVVLSANFLNGEWNNPNIRLPIVDTYLNSTNNTTTLQKDKKSNKLIIIILPSLNTLTPDNNIPMQLWEPLHRLLNVSNVLILNEKRHFNDELIRLMPSLNYFNKKKINASSIYRDDNSSTKIYNQSVYSSTMIAPYWSSPAHLIPQHTTNTLQHHQPQLSGYMSSDGDDSCCQHTTSTDDSADSLCYSTYCQHQTAPHNHVYSTIDDNTINIRPDSQQRMYFV